MSHSFSQDFCSKLEYHLCRTFANSADSKIRGFWCDGVNHSTISDFGSPKKFVNDNRMIETSAYLGKTGQDIYKMTIRFGSNSLSRFSRDLSLDPCLPSEDSMDWIDLDIENQRIEIQLN